MQNRDGLSLGCNIQTMLTNCAKLKPLNPFDISVRFSISWKVVQRIQLINNPQKQMINIHQYRRFEMCRPIAFNIFECFDILWYLCLILFAELASQRPNCLITGVFEKVPSITLQSSPEGCSPSPRIALVATGRHRFHRSPIRVAYPRLP